MQYHHLKTFKLPSGFRGRSGIYVQCWWLVQAILFKTSPQFMYGWRRFLVRCFGGNIGKKVKLRPSVHIQFPWKISIGDYSWIGDHVTLYSLGEITIGKNVVISQKSYICTGSHDHTDQSFAIYSKPVIIEDSCWLATDVFVAPGTIIHNGTVVGARSSVFHSLPAGKICFGTPAVVIKNRTAGFSINHLYHPLYHAEAQFQHLLNSASQ